ncbi:MAG: PilT/PilU family type 4a pilus ATPase [Phycisphaerales bacterium]|nr:PilT/PilU family type 4a pilus ATPase [Phycisphaerales bacterium]
MEAELHSADDPNPIDCHQVQEAETTERSKNPTINRLFKACCKLGASDLHLKAGSPPRFRLGGGIRLAQEPPLSSDEIDDMLFEVITDRQKQYFFEHGALDFAHQVPDLDRFRVNMFRQRGMTSVAARRVTKEIKTFEELGVPTVLREVSKFHQGLVLLAGITGSGKSTTIAAMINEINETRACHIVTVEDPIEYLFEDKKAFINQREIGIDVQDFHAALKYLMREDPDVVLVGEMRDRETFEAAMHASETGHLVFGTIHASSASQTITRILDLFPEEARALIRQSLVFNLKSVVCQKLLPSIHPERSRIPCCEIMITNPSIRKLIAEGRDFEITSVLKSSTEDGMQDFTEALYQLLSKEYLDLKVAMEVAPNPDELKMRLKGIRSGTGGAILG